MPNEPRPLGQQELDLVETLQPLMRREDDKLPAACEIEPGYFLRLVLDTWSNGAGRDGRKGHLTDSDIASELGRRTGERFDRNRYQATFGLGKKMADGTRQPQPVTRTVAKALLEIALRNWDPPLDRSGSKAPDTTPFAQLPHSRLDIAIETALKSMYGEDVHNVREVRCQKVVGVGWKGSAPGVGVETGSGPAVVPTPPTTASLLRFMSPTIAR